MNRKRDLLFNTVTIGIGSFSTKVLSILLLPIYTSVLSTQEYGVYDLLITISTFLIPMITLLMEEAMFRFLIDCKTEDEKVNVISQTFQYIIKSLILFVIVIAVIGKIFSISYIGLFILYLIATISIGLMNAITRGLGKIKLYSLTNVIVSIITIGLNIFFICSLKIGVAGLLLSSIIGNLAISIFIFFKLQLQKYIRICKEKNDETMKKMIKYSIPLVPNSISWGIINLSDRIIVSSVLGTSANGIYSMSNKFPSFMDTIYGFFYTAWKESASKALQDENVQEFYNSIYHILKNFLIAIVIGIIACLPFAFPLLIKGDFSEAYQYIPILIISMYFSNMSGFYGGIFSAYKNTKIMGTTTIISAVLNITVNLALIHWLGIWVATISTLVAVFFVYLQRRIKIKEYIRFKEKNRIMDLVISVITIYTYYVQNMILHVFILIVDVLYCVYINRDLLQQILYKIIKKILLYTIRGGRE